MRITEKRINKDYELLKKKASLFYKKGLYSLACLYMKKAAFLMYNSNLIYCDNELELLLKQLAKETIKQKNNTIKKGLKCKIVFYDYFVLENRGLTEQYLSALFKNKNYEVMFIGCNTDTSSIYTKLKEHKISYEIISEKDEIKRAQYIYDIISKIQPDILIAHISPWDVEGLMATSMVENKCKKFLINITDHAFWLGTTIFDYFFEFRDYGYNISKSYRNIDELKLLKLPFYPIINSNFDFQGFDFKIDGRKVIFSGGNVYKIQGSPVFLELVKYILIKHPETIFLYLGASNSQYLDTFITKNNFQNRFYYRAERKDIFEVFKNCYFYLNTYPLSGGLMTQYACVAGKLPLTFRDSDNPESDIGELFITKPDFDIQFSDLHTLMEKIDFYLDNPKELQKNEQKIKEVVIKENRFDELFYNYLDNSKNILPVNIYNIDLKKFAKQYLERFNEDKNSYYIQFVSRDLRTLPYFLKYYIFYAFLRIRNKIKLKINN